MNYYLIFRTDRIGDFLLSLILIKSIKRNDKKAFIVVIASKKNFEYIKSFDLIDRVFLINRNFLDKIDLINSLRKYYFKNVIIHDGKNRSKLINFFIKKKRSIFVNNNDISISHFTKLKNILFRLNFDFNESDLNFLDFRKYKTVLDNNESYIVFHYDEKWDNSTYISKYKNIKPSIDDLIYFLENIQSKLKKKIIVTTGLKTPKILTSLFSQYNNKMIKLYENLNFFELEEIVSQSNLLIACHGSISHIASAHNIKQIDIIDENIKNPYKNWTEHFRKYNYVYRNFFPKLKIEIIKLL